MHAHTVLVTDQFIYVAVLLVMRENTLYIICYRI